MDCVFNNIREQGAKLTGQIRLWFISPQKPVEYRMHSNVAQTSGIHIHTLGNGYIQMYLFVGKPVFHLCPIDVCLMFATRLDGQQCKVWGLQFIATKLQTSDWRTRQCTIQTLQTFQKV